MIHHSWFKANEMHYVEDWGKCYKRGRLTEYLLRSKFGLACTMNNSTVNYDYYQYYQFICSSHANTLILLCQVFKQHFLILVWNSTRKEGNFNASESIFHILSKMLPYCQIWLQRLLLTQFIRRKSSSRQSSCDFRSFLYCRCQSNIWRLRW